MAAGILVKASVKGYFSQDYFFCASNGLNKYGMSIESDRALAMGDIINCSMFMPGMGRVHAAAEVVKISKRKGGSSRYGLRFLRLAAEYKSAFEGALSDTRFTEVAA